MRSVALKATSFVPSIGGKAGKASALVALVLAPGLSGCFLGTERPDPNLEIPAIYR
jgi:multidrug efflux system outer membrane protein